MGIAMVSKAIVIAMKGSAMMVVECKFPMPSFRKLAAHGKTAIVPVMSGRRYPPYKK